MTHNPTLSWLYLSRKGSMNSAIHVVAKFIAPEYTGYIVDSGIGLMYKPASLCSLAGRHDNPMPKSTLSPQSGI
jgi:hypothetical protein